MHATVQREAAGRLGATGGAAPHGAASPVAREYFDDVYSLAGYLADAAAGPGAESGLRFVYRPALVEERARLGEACRRLAPDEADRRVAEFVAQRIIACHSVDSGRENGASCENGSDAADGSAILVTGENLFALERAVFARLPAVVLGHSDGEIDPRWSEATRSEHRKLVFAAAERGQSVGEYRERRDERRLAWAVGIALAHPRLAERTCERCTAWMHDEAHRIKLWNGRPLARPAESPTPCWQCPKQSPVAGAIYEQMLPRVERLIDFHARGRATCGRSLDGGHLRDAHLLRDLAIVDTCVRRWERSLPKA